MKILDKLLIDLRTTQYKINNAKTKDYKDKFTKERIKLEKEIFYHISLAKDDMGRRELDRFMYEKVIPVILDTTNNLGNWEQYEITGRLQELYEGVYIETGNAIASGVKGGVSFNMIRPEMVEKAVFNEVDSKMFSDRVWHNKGRLADRVYRDVYSAIRDGDDLRKLSRKLAKDFDVGVFESMRLLQNETTRVMEQAQTDIYEQSDVVIGTKFVATLDNSTTEICQSLDGNEYKKGENKPNIPEDTHIGCRSTYIPIVEGWSPTTRRDNLNKKEIDYVEYRDW